jgi:hypothetical protein
VDDCADAMPLPAGPWKQWHTAWARAKDKRLPRTAQAFAWLLLHAALPVGGASVQRFPDNGADLAAQVCCRNAACRPTPANPLSTAGPSTSTPAASSSTVGWQLETLQHSLMFCPAVRPAVEWMAAVWGRISGTPPPFTSDVWLQDNQSSWSPQPDDYASRTWTFMRATLLSTAWEWRCRRDACGVQFTAGQVISACIAVVERQVRADWQRVVSDVVLVAGTSRSWFRGRDPTIPLVEFEARWCRNAVVARVRPAANASSKPQLEFRLVGPTAGAAGAGGSGGGGRGGGGSGGGSGGGGSGGGGRGGGGV